MTRASRARPHRKLDSRAEVEIDREGSVASWTKCGDLMLFGRLDVSGGSGTLTLAYRFTDDGSDGWTARLNRFKAGKAPDVRGACATIPEALSTVTIPGSRIVVVGAIGSGSTTLVPGCPVAQLGEAIARRFGWTWSPGLLAKPVTRPLHTIRSGRGDRNAELAGKYTAGPLGQADTVVVVDDLCTAGTTLAEVTRAIRATTPNAAVFGVMAGKTERLAYMKSMGVDVDNGHVPAKYARMWDNA